MRAVVFERAGEPHEVLHLVDTAKPQVSPGSALVRVAARPIQPADLAFVRGQYRIRPAFPQTAGLEGSGVVVQAGASGSIAEDDRVAFRSPGTWADFAAIPIARLIKVPAGVPDDAACQISLNPVTAWALLREASVNPGDWIVLTAATSTVSNLVGVLARRRGVRVIGLVRGDEEAARARCTAGHILSTDRPSLAAEIGGIAGKRSVKALLDSVGGQLIPPLFETLTPGGRIIAYGVQDRGPAAVTNAMLIYSNLTWQGFGIDRWLEQLAPVESQTMYDELWEMLRDGTLTLPVAATHGLADFPDALKVDAAQGRTGKVILVS